MVLRKVSVEALGKGPGDVAEPPIVNFELGVARPSNVGLDIKLDVSLTHEGVLRAGLTYVGRFLRLEAGAAPREEDLRFFAAKIAPTVLYPFIRETLASLVVKTGLPPLILPVLNFGEVFDPNEVEIPPVADETEEESD